MNKKAILLIVEPGLLEQQAKMLVASINRYIDPELKFDVFAFSPRKNRKANENTKRYFIEHQVKYIEDDLNLEYDSFPLANGLFASAYFENNYPEYEHIILSDTDTVFINSLPLNIFTENTCYVSPADNKGVGTTGEEDNNDAFWKAVFDYFDLSLQAPEMITTVRQKLIRPYHNSGFVLVNNIKGFYNQWLLDFQSLMASGIRPDFVGRDGTNFGFFEQFVLSITTLRYPDCRRYFPKEINYPLPFMPFLKNRRGHPSFNQLIHIHYHKWFQHPDFLDHVTSEKDKQTEQYRWLKAHLPLDPTIQGQFKC